MAVLPKVRSALCAASQLTGEGALMWKMLLHLHVNQNLMMMMKNGQLSFDKLKIGKRKAFKTYHIQDFKPDFLIYTMYI